MSGFKETSFDTSELFFDAAGRLRTSNVTSLGDYKILNGYLDTNLLLTAGTATFTTNTNNLQMSVTSGQYGILYSKMYHPYLNDKSQKITMTAFNMGAASNVEKSMEYMSSSATAPHNTALDGIRLFKDTSNNYSFQIWRNGTQLNTPSLQFANWIDKLDGTGPSGMTVDWNNFNVIMCDFLWLGGTTIRFYINYAGKNWTIASHYYANTDNQPFILSPNKQIRWVIRSTTGSGTLNAVCAAVGSEGQINQMGITRPIKGTTGGVSNLSSAVSYAICGVRKATTYRDIFAVVESFEGIISTNDFIDWTLVLNPTIAGTVTWTALSGTPFETFQGALTNTVTGGFDISNTYSSLNMNNAKGFDSVLARLNSTITNTMDNIVLVATPSLGSSAVRVTGSMQVRWIY